MQKLRKYKIVRRFGMQNKLEWDGYDCWLLDGKVYRESELPLEIDGIIKMIPELGVYRYCVERGEKLHIYAIAEEVKNV